MSVTLQRDAGHPWSGEPGWDHLYLEAADQAALIKMIALAEDRFWQVWIRDSATHAALMYKPSGATAHWADAPRTGTDKSICRALAVGEQVVTDFSGQVTAHRVTERLERQISGTGIMLRVSPPVKGSSFLSEDPGQPSRTFNNAWIDSGWFRPAAQIIGCQVSK